MTKAKRCGVQRLTRETDRRSNRGIAQRLWRQFTPPAIGLIADQPVPGMGHMDADLMGAPGFQPAFHQAGHRRRAETFHNAHPCYGMTPAMEQNRLTLAIGLVAGKLRGDFQNAPSFETGPTHAVKPWVIRVGLAVNQRQIATIDGVLFELRGQSVVGTVRLSHHQQTGCVLVDPVNDSRAPFATDA